MSTETPVIEPISVTIAQAMAMTGLGRSTIYLAIGRGELEAVKVNGRTLIIFQSLKQRIASLPRIGRDLPMMVPAALRKPSVTA